jgi:hypothetical protein
MNDSPRLLQSRCSFAMTLIVLFSFSGCAIIHHMDELQMMAAYSRDKNVQHAMIKKNDASYDALVEVIKNGKIKSYTSSSAFIQNFGEPISKKNIDSNTEQWLYRHAIPQKAKSKVYVYFDAKGQLIKFEQEQIQW